MPHPERNIHITHHPCWTRLPRDRRPDGLRLPVRTGERQPGLFIKEKGDKSNLPRSGPEGASHKLDLSPFSPAACGRSAALVMNNPGWYETQ